MRRAVPAYFSFFLHAPAGRRGKGGACSRRDECGRRRVLRFAEDEQRVVGVGMTEREGKRALGFRLESKRFT